MKLKLFPFGSTELSFWTTTADKEAHSPVVQIGIQKLADFSQLCGARRVVAGFQSQRTSRKSVLQTNKLRQNRMRYLCVFVFFRQVMKFGLRHVQMNFDLKVPKTSTDRARHKFWHEQRFHRDQFLNCRCSFQSYIYFHLPQATL